MNYDNRKIYYIHHYTDYEDGTSVETKTETFPGTERRAALARFAELKKISRYYGGNGHRKEIMGEIKRAARRDPSGFLMRKYVTNR